jgi:plastocyanin
MRQNSVRVFAALALLAAPAACSRDDGGPAPPPADAKRVDVSKAGAVAGKITFEGPVPVNAPVKLSADPFCEKAHPNGMTFETYLVTDGGLDNVFVYVKDGLSGYAFDMPAGPVKLDQQACRYVPHVFGVRAGQPIEIGTSDATAHNVHAMPHANTAFNFGLDIPGTRQNRTFKNPEVLVPLKCDVHNWMQAYVGVVGHPYFAVSARGGAFELKDLPAGTYTIEAVHEKLGAQTETVTIGERESKTIGFTFKAPAAGAP